MATSPKRFATDGQAHADAATAAAGGLTHVETEQEALAGLESKNTWDPKAEAIRSIDYTNLEDAIFSHLSLFQQLTAPIPLARKNLAMAKLDLERVKAEIDTEIREANAKAGARITEAAIASKIAGDPRVYDITSRYLTMKQVMDELEHNKDVMYNREQTIRNLIALKRADWTAASGF